MAVGRLECEGLLVAAQVQEGFEEEGVSGPKDKNMGQLKPGRRASSSRHAAFLGRCAAAHGQSWRARRLHRVGARGYFAKAKIVLETLDQKPRPKKKAKVKSNAFKELF